jgi:hypothetical protein
VAVFLRFEEYIALDIKTLGSPSTKGDDLLPKVELLMQKNVDMIIIKNVLDSHPLPL